jgi:hypothetical protein
MARQSPVGLDLLIVEAPRSYSDTPHSAGLLWTSDQPDAKTSNWQHITLKRDGYPLPARLKPATPGNERPQTQALDRTAAGIGIFVVEEFKSYEISKAIKNENVSSWSVL